MRVHTTFQSRANSQRKLYQLGTALPRGLDWTLDVLFPPDIVELKVEPLQTSREALTAASVSAEKVVDDLGQNV